MDNLLDLFSNFTVIDAVDIFVVSFFLYKFFSLIQGTRAVQVLVGTAAITTLYWLSLTVELYTLSFLLKSFFDYFFIVLIVLFQDQIRSGLALLGRTKVFSRQSKNLYDMQIEEVVTACSALSREKIGAIIVFERLNGLLNYSSTGTKLDSRIHSDIMYAIFQNNSPLHDGAIILFQDRIQAAGCFLPLSKKIELDRHYGTRHRAALGITEVSDAVVVTVSEETGQMSLCFNRHFITCDSEDSLRKNLRSSLYSAKLDDLKVAA